MAEKSILFVGVNCPECERVVSQCDLTGVTILDAQGDADGMATAVYHDVFSTPTLLLADGRKVAGADDIIKELSNGT